MIKLINFDRYLVPNLMCNPTDKQLIFLTAYVEENLKLILEQSSYDNND